MKWRKKHGAVKEIKTFETLKQEIVGSEILDTCMGQKIEKPVFKSHDICKEKVCVSVGGGIRESCGALHSNIDRNLN